jgi:hypothetical protein
VQDEFSFVSTTSALDATPNISPYTTFNFAQNGNANTATSKYISQERIGTSNSFNLNHTDYTARNASWIFTEMEHPQNPLSPVCNDFCLADIAGPVSFCTAATYYYAVPPGSLVAWQVINILPIGSVTFQVNADNSITLTRVNNGQATIVAITTSNCFSSGPSTLQKNIIFGGQYSGYFTTSLSSTPVPILFGGSTHTIITPRGSSVNVQIQLTNLQNISNLNWYLNNYTNTVGGNSFSLSGTASIYSYSNTYISTLLTANSPCGNISSIYGFNLQTLSGRYAEGGDTIGINKYTANPNPVLNSLNISVENSTNNKIQNNTGYYTVKISELNTFLPLKQMGINKTGNNFQISMAGFKTGYYAVEITDGQNSQVIKVFKL